MKKVVVRLDSPYKWGKGWTGSHEEHEELKDIFGGIVAELGMEVDVNKYGVVEGSKGKNNVDSAYMHPMELVFTLEKESKVTIYLIQLVVNKYISGLDFDVSIERVSSPEFTVE
jgi:hypothetical protein